MIRRSFIGSVLSLLGVPFIPSCRQEPAPPKPEQWTKLGFLYDPRQSTNSTLFVNGLEVARGDGFTSYSRGASVFQVRTSNLIHSITDLDWRCESREVDPENRWTISYMSEARGKNYTMTKI